MKLCNILLVQFSFISFRALAHCATLVTTIKNDTNMPLNIIIDDLTSNNKTAFFSYEGKAETASFLNIALGSGKDLVIETNDTDAFLGLGTGSKFHVRALWHYDSYIKYKYPKLCDKPLIEYKNCPFYPFSDNLRFASLFDFNIDRNLTFTEAGSVHVVENPHKDALQGHGISISTNNGSCADNRQATASITLKGQAQ